MRGIGTPARPRPRQHQPVAVAILAEPIEPSPRGRLVHAGEPPPAMTHGIQRLGFGIGQPQARRNALCVLGDGDRERAEPPDSIRLPSKHAFRRDHRLKRPGIGDAAENRQQQTAIRHRGDGDSGAFRDHQLQHFHAHAFGGKGRKAGARANAGEVARTIGLTRAEGGVNAEKPQDTQIVFRDPPVRVADEAHAFCSDIVKSADVIVHHAIGVNRQAVDGEVAPLRIAGPVASECDLGLAAERLGVLAQRRDFKRLRIDDQCHGAVFDARRHAFDAGRLGAADHFIGDRGGCDIDIAGRNLQ
jgi:hypothetical protein